MTPDITIVPPRGGRKEPLHAWDCPRCRVRCAAPESEMERVHSGGYLCAACREARAQEAAEWLIRRAQEAREALQQPAGWDQPAVILIPRSEFHYLALAGDEMERLSAAEQRQNAARKQNAQTAGRPRKDEANLSRAALYKRARLATNKREAARLRKLARARSENNSADS